MEYHKTRGSVLMCIRSRDLTNTPTNDYNSSGRFTLFEGIDAEPDEVLSIKLLSAIIPNSWYNLDSGLSNNILSITEKKLSDSVEKSWTITIPNGSYNIDELNAVLKTALDADSIEYGYSLVYTLSYDKATNSDTITSNSYATYNTTFKFSEGNSCRRFLGFTSNDKVITTEDGIVSDRAVDITDTYNSIYIRLPNLTSSKVIESYSTRFSNVIAQIPIQYSRNSIMVFEPSNPFELEINNRNITSIFISITFQNELQQVNFGAGDWEVNLQVDYYKKRSRYKKHIPTLHKNIINRHRKYLEKQNEDKQRIQEIEQLVNSKN